MLRGIDLTVEPGQLVALVGPSGAGKTTLTGLVARLYDPDAGSVRINGVDLRDATLASISDTVGVVTQEAHLFHDTIRANLAYAAPEATDAQMWAALEAAQVRRLVELLPSGLDTVVGDRGHRLSGGEKQRLALALRPLPHHRQEPGGYPALLLRWYLTVRSAHPLYRHSAQQRIDRPWW